MSSRRSRSSLPATLTPPIRSATNAKAHLEDMHEKFVYFTLQAERNRMLAGSSGLPEPEAKALYDRMVHEFNTNPKFPRCEFPPKTKKAARVAYMRKCLAVCREDATTTEAHTLHWITATIALQFIMTIELTHSREHNLLVTQWNKEAQRILYPEPKPYQPPVDAFDAPQLLDWVGLSFTHPTTKVRYEVEDAGTSVTSGTYFVLQTEDGQREQMPTERFASMVKGIPIPADDDD
ncbi:hypothetical protein BV25DRAFT_1902626 [Artomyces pyxidatus]|uniref:Uncharacterized protein n=1 Tax=Artomyces pyxidatus TaxID=48021 RepID=A0ACB8SNU2_9AGAM|nr:hypothetical protein BV25DRAFT_1902626 [Artomyces pyxidatus]